MNQSKTVVFSGLQGSQGAASALEKETQKPIVQFPFSKSKVSKLQHKSIQNQKLQNKHSVTEHRELHI